MLFTRMQMRNIHMMDMSLFRDTIFMMQVSHTRVQMQSLSLMVPVHIFNRNANVFLQRWKCEFLLIGMSWCKCPYVRMPWRECPLVHMQWMQMSAWEYAYDVNAPLWVYHDTNALMQTQFIQKFPLFSKRGFLSAWNQNIFKTWFIIHEKSFSFLLKAPKKLMITVRNFWMGYWLEIQWFGSRDLFSKFGWAKRVARFQGLFFWKNEFLKNQAS